MGTINGHGRHLFKLQEDTMVYQNICNEFKEKEHHYQVDDSVQDTINQMEIVLETNPFLFSILYHSKSPVQKIEIYSKMSPFDPSQSYTHVYQDGHYFKYKEGMGKTYLHTLMVSYGYAWIQSNVSKFTDGFRNAIKDANLSLAEVAKKCIKKWNITEKTFISSLDKNSPNLFMDKITKCFPSISSESQLQDIILKIPRIDTFSLLINDEIYQYKNKIEKRGFDFRSVKKYGKRKILQKNAIPENNHAKPTSRMPQKENASFVDKIERQELDFRSLHKQTSKMPQKENTSCVDKIETHELNVRS
jgi:uncharacterized protein (UPF0335 family)